jgi:hypothetical protein
VVVLFHPRLRRGIKQRPSASAQLSHAPREFHRLENLKVGQTSVSQTQSRIYPLARILVGLGMQLPGHGHGHGQPNDPTIAMAPIIQTKHSRANRSARNPRGIYAALLNTDTATSEPAPTDTAEEPPTDADAATSWKRKRKRADDDPFAFSSRGGFQVNKKDKRAIRHNVLLAKVQEGGVQKRTRKRRRPAKKLKTDVGDLAHALPDVGEAAAGGGGKDDEDEWEGMSEDDTAMAGLEGMRKAQRKRTPALGEGKMKMHSLRHRPRAMKRRRRMEQGEMDRFARNLAQMVGQAGQQEKHAEGNGTAQADGARAETAAAAVGGASQADRWAALRHFIGGTMEKDKAFASV